MEPAGLGKATSFSSLEEVVDFAHEYPNITNLILDPSGETKDDFQMTLDNLEGTRLLNTEERQKLIRLLEEKNKKG